MKTNLNDAMVLAGLTLTVMLGVPACLGKSTSDQGPVDASSVREVKLQTEDGFSPEGQNFDISVDLVEKKASFDVGYRTFSPCAPTMEIKCALEAEVTQEAADQLRNAIVALKIESSPQDRCVSDVGHDELTFDGSSTVFLPSYFEDGKAILNCDNEGKPLAVEGAAGIAQAFKKISALLEESEAKKCGEGTDVKSVLKTYFENRAAYFDPEKQDGSTEPDSAPSSVRLFVPACMPPLVD